MKISTLTLSMLPSNNLLEQHKKINFWRLKMMKIDIDRLLESTTELKTDKSDLQVKKIEIDKILEITRNW
jgi:hypothetical protein